MRKKYVDTSIQTLTLLRKGFIKSMFKLTPNISSITSKIILIAFGFLAKNKKGTNNESFTHGARYAKISQSASRSKPNPSFRIEGIISPRPLVMITIVAMFPAKGRFLPSEPMFGFKLKLF